MTIRRFERAPRRSVAPNGSEAERREALRGMKIAVSSAAYAAAFSAARLTQLEWLDVCANELEVDGVVLDIAHFPRTDDEYLAQVKKTATDLGLTIAALASPRALPQADTFALASLLGAPIVVTRAPHATDDPLAWSAFVSDAKTCARAAKTANVVVALACAGGTLCADAADSKRLAYDVDGSWLRSALDPQLSSPDGGASLLAKAVIAVAVIDDARSFAREADERALAIVRALVRFRGFISFEADGASDVREVQAALARFVELRYAYLFDRARTHD